MKCHYFKDVKKRAILKKLELKKLIHVFLVYSTGISDAARYKIYINFFFCKKLNINFEVKNHCLLTKNTKAVNRFTGLTRSNLKHLLDWGYICGIRKHSW